MGTIKTICRALIGSPEEEKPNTMLLVDARSGLKWVVPDDAPTTFEVPLRADYGDGEFIEVLSFEPGLVKARALIRHHHLDYAIFDYGGKPPAKAWVTDENWVPLQVRWFHPGFMREHVAFIPS